MNQLNLNSQKTEGAKAAGDTRLIIDVSRCPQNHACPAVKACPVGALLQAGHRAPVLDVNKCIKCGLCTEICPTGALKLSNVLVNGM